MEIKILANINRLKDIAKVMLRFGFEDLLERIDLPGVPMPKPGERAEGHLATEERIRRVLEDLGSTFIKFGQIMSLRPDLLPASMIRELGKLQDNVSAVAFEAIRAAVEDTYQQKLEEVFAVFDPEPLAAASIAQVHKAVLRREGAIVSVKIRRPRIRSTMEKDMDILDYIAHRLHANFEPLKVYDLPALVHHVRRTLRREMDLRREARHIAIARSHLREESDIQVPAVFEDYTSESILVMAHIQGTQVKELQFEDEDQARFLARLGLRTAIRQILDDGFFHADPHPSNMMVTADNQLCLIDWGMVGRLTERDRRELVELLQAIIQRESHGLMTALFRLGEVAGDIDRRGLERELLDVVDTYYAVPLEEMNIGQLLMAIANIMREYRLQLHPDLLLMIKALVTAEGTARMIYPRLNIIAEARPDIERLARERFGLRRIWQMAKSSLPALLHHRREIPGRLLRIMQKVEDGDLTIQFAHTNLENLLNTLENITNRLTFAMIIAAMIVGSSMIITTGVRPHIMGYPAIGVVGYFISAIIGLWLLFNIIRTRKY
ncbi:MAG: AarF/UbiB family protein [Desulfobacterales bacterium]